jgi:hypothetical protein
VFRAAKETFICDCGIDRTGRDPNNGIYDRTGGGYDIGSSSYGDVVLAGATGFEETFRDSFIRRDTLRTQSGVYQDRAGREDRLDVVL